MKLGVVVQTGRVHFSEYDTRLAAYAVIVDDGQILMAWYNGATPQWTLPGGGVEFEESIEDAVVREVLEETGFEVRVGPPLMTWSFTSDQGSRPYKSVRIVFSATIAGGTLGTRERNGTTDFARWLPLDAISTLEPRAEVVDVAMHAFARRSPSRPTPFREGAEFFARTGRLGSGVSAEPAGIFLRQSVTDCLITSVSRDP